METSGVFLCIRIPPKERVFLLYANVRSYYNIPGIFLPGIA